MIRRFVAEALASAVRRSVAERSSPGVGMAGLQADAAAVDPAHPAIARMIEAGESLGIDPGPPVAFSAVTDGRHLTNLGGVPVHQLRSGDIGSATVRTNRCRWTN